MSFHDANLIAKQRVDVAVPPARCLHSEPVRRSFDEGISSRYDEISGLDRAVPDWNFGARRFFNSDQKNLEEKSLCHT
jgi:hypothetical protein